MASEFKITRTVQFSDTDLAGIVHFSNYFRYMEACEHAFLRSLGLSVIPKPGLPQVGWPRVAVNCEYKRPLRFEDDVDITLKVASKTEKAVTYNFFFRKTGDDQDCATGSMTVVCCSFRDGKMQATFIPPEFSGKLEVAK